MKNKIEFKITGIDYATPQLKEVIKRMIALDPALEKLMAETEFLDGDKFEAMAFDLNPNSRNDIRVHDAIGRLIEYTRTEIGKIIAKKEKELNAD